MVTQTLHVMFRDALRPTLKCTIKKESIMVLEGTLGFVLINNDMTLLWGYNPDVIDNFAIQD